MQESKPIQFSTYIHLGTAMSPKGALDMVPSGHSRNRSLLPLFTRIGEAVEHTCLSRITAPLGKKDGANRGETAKGAVMRFQFEVTFLFAVDLV